MGIMTRLFTWWRVDTIGTALFTWRKGRQIGVDQLGNRYFEERHGRRRWVLYAGEVEASSVPAEWHAWLHHTTDARPTEGASRHDWERPHMPNPTGTPDAYRPPGHLSKGGQRDRATGDYEPWRP